MWWRSVEGWVSGVAVVAALSACGGNTETQPGGAANGGASSATPSSHASGGSDDSTVNAAGAGPTDPAQGGSAGSAPWDPLADIPDALGPVKGPPVTVPASCCSRRSGPTMACPAGADVAEWGTIAKAGDTIVLSGTAATLGTSFQVMALASPASGPVAIALVELAATPPVGVADASPVYRVEAKSALPPLAVKVPMASNQRQFAADSTGLYFSVDGSSFERIADSYQNAGFLQATMPGAGFVFAGSSPSSGDCQ